MKGVPSLTGIRGIAAVGVVIYHIWLMSADSGYTTFESIPFANRGWIGVDLFFILSGFILMYVHAVDFKTIQTPSLIRFAKLRMWRIYPLSCAVLLFIAIMVGLDADFRGWFAAQAPGNLSVVAFLKTLVLGNRWIPVRGEWNQPAWSVSAEIIGYLIFPWLCFFIMRCSRALCMTLAITLLVIFGLLSYELGKINNNDIHAWALVRMAFGFSVGAILFRVWHLAPSREVEQHALLSALASAAIIVLCIFPRLMVFMEAAFALLIYSLASQRGFVDRVLSTKPIVVLGKISFPLYLLHSMPLALLMYHLQKGSVKTEYMIVFLTIYIVAVLCGAYLLHVFVERPSHRLARQHTRALDQAA